MVDVLNAPTQAQVMESKASALQGSPLFDQVAGASLSASFKWLTKGSDVES